MTVPSRDASSERLSRVRLPADAPARFEVYLNGVPQRLGEDYRVEGDALVFSRPLEREGRLGVLRWTSMLLGIAGSYGQNDAVDVVYERDGRRIVASGLPIERSDT